MADSSAVTEELKSALAAQEGARGWISRLSIVAGVALALVGAVTWSAKHRPPPPAKFVTAVVSVGDVVEKVQATGTVQPLLQVNVGAQVNGRVTRVLVDFNSVVHKGDVLAEIDPTIYGTQVNAQAAQVMAQRAQMESAKAQLESMKAQLATAKVALDRVQRLYDNNLASKADLDSAKGTFDSFRAQVDSAAGQVNA